MGIQPNREQPRAFSRLLFVLMLTTVMIATNLLGSVPDNPLSAGMRKVLATVFPAEFIAGLNHNLLGYNLPTLPNVPGGSPGAGSEHGPDVVGLIPSVIGGLFPSQTPTPSVTFTPTRTSTATATATMTFTATATPTDTPTDTPTNTPTSTFTRRPTYTFTWTPLPPPADTPTDTPTP